MIRRVSLNQRLFTTKGEHLIDYICPVCGTPTAQSKDLDEEKSGVTLYDVLSAVLQAQTRQEDPKQTDREEAEKLLLDVHYAHKANMPITFKSNARILLKKRLRMFSGIILSTQVCEILDGNDNPLNPEVVEEKAQQYKDQLEIEIKIEAEKEAKIEARKLLKDSQKETQEITKETDDTNNNIDITE